MEMICSVTAECQSHGTHINSDGFLHEIPCH